MSDQPETSGADRQANRHLLLPRERPDEQQIADIGAGDEQYRQHDDERDGQRRQQSARVVERGLPQREEPDAAAAIGLGEIRFEAAGDGRHFGLRLLDRHTRFEPDEAFDPARAAILELVDSGVELRLHRRRNPELKRVTDEGAVKPFRRHADDRVRQAVEHLSLADDSGIAVEPFLPHLIADDGDRMRAAA